MSDIVSITSLKVEMSIGAYEWEKKVRQTVLIDIDLFCDSSAPGESDNLNDAIDYAKVSKQVTEICLDRHFLLIESLAETIASKLTSSPQISAVQIRVSKPGAVENAESVSVTIKREA